MKELHIALANKITNAIFDIVEKDKCLIRSKIEERITEILSANINDSKDIYSTASKY